MTKVIVHQDCGSSPRNLFVQKLIAANAKKDVKFMLRYISDDIRWNIVGGGVHQGRDRVTRVLEQIEVEELTTCHITNTQGGAVKAITTYGIDLR